MTRNDIEMSDAIEITIHDYDESMAEGVALEGTLKMRK